MTFAVTTSVVDQFILMVINDHRALVVGLILIQHREGFTVSDQFCGCFLNSAAVEVFRKGREILAASEVDKMFQGLLTDIAALALQFGNDEIDLIGKLFLGCCYFQSLD